MTELLKSIVSEFWENNYSRHNPNIFYFDKVDSLQRSTINNICVFLIQIQHITRQTGQDTMDVQK